MTFYFILFSLDGTSLKRKRKYIKRALPDRYFFSRKFYYFYISLNIIIYWYRSFASITLLGWVMVVSLYFMFILFVYLSLLNWWLSLLIPVYCIKLCFYGCLSSLFLCVASGLLLVFMVWILCSFGLWFELGRCLLYRCW